MKRSLIRKKRWILPVCLALLTLFTTLLPGYWGTIVPATAVTEESAPLLEGDGLEGEAFDLSNTLQPFADAIALYDLTQNHPEARIQILTEDKLSNWRTNLKLANKISQR